jgi:hypothetical protein
MNSVTLSDLVSKNAHFSNIANIDNEPVISDNVTPLPCHLNEFIITEQEILDQLKILKIRVVCSFSFIMNSVTLSDLVSNFIIHEWFIIWSNCNSLGRYIFF